VSPGPTLRHLTQRLLAALDRYRGLAAQPPHTPAHREALEQTQDVVLTVLQLGTGILADAEEGEQVLIPDPIIRMGQEHERRPNAEELDECCAFVRAVLSYASLETEWLQAAPHLVSPLLCKQLLQFLTRYCQCYLLPEVDEYSDFCVTYAVGFRHGADLLEAALRTALEALRRLGHESLVQTHSPALLLTVVRRKGVEKLLPSSAAWRELAQTETTGGFGALPPSCRRAVFEALCVGYGTQGSEGLLLQPLFNHFTAVLRQPGFADNAQREDIRREVDLDLERLRGMSRASLAGRAQSHRTFQFLLATGILDALVILVDVYHMCHSVVLAVIRCFDDFVVSQNLFSSDSETAYLCEKCIKLLEAYSSRATARLKNAIPESPGSRNLIRSPSKPESLTALEEDEDLETLRGLLDLLVHITQWDLLDFSGEPGGRKFDIGGACFIGFGLVVRLVNDDTLQHPPLCCQFFTLLLHLVEVYPDQLSRLDDRMFGVVLHAIAYAVDHPSVEVSRLGFRSMAAIALYHHGTRCSSPLGHKLQDNLFAQMCTKVLHVCVGCYFDSSLLPSVGLACWALFCVLQAEGIGPLIDQCLAGQPQAARLAPAFRHLLTAGDVQFVTTPKCHKTTFMTNFEAFVATTRALRMK